MADVHRAARRSGPKLTQVAGLRGLNARGRFDASARRRSAPAHPASTVPNYKGILISSRHRCGRTRGMRSAIPVFLPVGCTLESSPRCLARDDRRLSHPGQNPRLTAHHAVALGTLGSGQPTLHNRNRAHTAHLDRWRDSGVASALTDKRLRPPHRSPAARAQAGTAPAHGP